MKDDLVIEGKHYETGNFVRIEIRGGLISGITEIPDLDYNTNVLYVAPGLIDNQVNGYAGVDFAGEDIEADEILRAAREMITDGVTSFLPTLITASHDKLIRNFRTLSEILESHEILKYSIPGFHLEGPYISPEDGFRGCHPINHVRKPSIDEMKELQLASGNKIIQVTLAPESEGAVEFIKYCVSEGILVAIGHTNATALQIKQACDNGARLSTHLGNGCANMIHRHENPIWQQLADDRLTPTVIADGFHLLPEEISVFYKVKGPGNLILTSDMVYLAGMASGKYSYLDTEVMLTQSGKLMDLNHNCLAGASFPLKKGVENMMNFTNCSLADAINMASGNVAKAYGLDDRGTLEAGKRADLIMFELEGKSLKIRKTCVKGESF